MKTQTGPACPPHDMARPARNRVFLIALCLALVALALPGLGPGGRADDTGGQPLDCPPCPDDGNQCTLEYCLNGQCVHDPIALNRHGCEDGNKCTLNDTCEAGTCFSGNIFLSCNDNNPCTDDRCDTTTGCVFTPRDRYCDDHNACTVGDWCMAGVCTSTGSVSCDDGNPCTSDACVAAAGCQHAASAGTCDDAGVCTSGDHCEAGVCTGVTSCPCPDGDHDGWADCTITGCDPTGVVCGDCNDGDPAVHPGASEVCNQRDDDCDGAADEGFPRVFVANKIVSPFAQDGARFGASLAPVGDVNRDGVGDIVVGAPGPLGTSGAPGAVALLSGRDRSVLCIATDPGASVNAHLGSAVVGIGDVNGDHVPDFAAGAPGQSRVVLFSGADCAPLYACGDSVTVTYGSPQIGFSQAEGIVALGAPLAAPGDVNGDGIPDLVAADPSSNQSSPFGHPFLSVGSISIMSGASCQRIARAIGTGVDNFGRFGTSLAVLPDITGDGVRDLAVGELAPSPTMRGGVRLVSGASGATIRQLSNPASTFGNQLGSAVAPLRNGAGTGLLAIVAGANLEDSAAGIDTGSVVIFDPTGPVLRTCLDPEAAPGDNLGAALAEIPDLNGDGVPEIAAAAPLDDNDLGIDAGSVLVFSGADCTLLARLTDATGQAGARMGDRAVVRLADLDGDGADDFGVGSALDDAGGPDRGSIIVYTARSDCSASALPPIALVTAPGVSECDRPGGAMVSLDGSQSHAEGATSGEGIAAYAWFEDYGLPGQRSLGTLPIVAALLPTGDHTITLRVTDAQGLTGSDTLTISVRDTHAPVLSVLADPFVLWPPNHEMIPVAVAWTLADTCDPSPVLTLVSVTSSEPDDAAGSGDGKTTGDIEGADAGTPDAALLLRAERDNGGTGRVYTLTYAATDASGNRAIALGVVTVPHDQGSGPEPLLLRAGMTGAGDTVRLVWPAVPGASSYDVIRGDLGNWRFADGQVLLGPVTLIGAAVTGTTIDEAAADAAPPLGAAWFYLIQYRTASGPSGYGTESAPGPRIPE